MASKKNKEKACLICRTIYSGEKCPNCGNSQYTDSFKGKVYIFNPEKSEIAYKLKLDQKGEFAIKTK